MSARRPPRTRTSTTGIALRIASADAVASVVIALLVAATAFIATLPPRLWEHTLGAELRYATGELAGIQRDLTAATVQTPTWTETIALADPFGDGEPAIDGADGRTGFAEVAHGIETWLDELGTPLDDLAGAPTIVFTAPAVTVDDPEQRPVDPDLRLDLVADPGVAEHVRFVDGRAPASVIGAVEGTGAPVEIALSTGAAATMGDWRVGETRMLAGTFPAPVTLVGLFEPVDTADSYWQHLTTGLSATVFDDGNQRPIATASAWVDAADVRMLSALQDARGGTRLALWFPVDTAGIDVAAAPALSTQLFAIGTQGQRIAGVPVEVDFDSRVGDTVDAVLGRAVSGQAVLTSVQAGPLGVALAVLALAGQLLVQRRRPALTLAIARGADPRTIRMLMAANGLLVGLPAAAIGAAAAVLVAPGGIRVGEVVLAALVGIAPAGILAFAARPATLRASRADLGGRGSRLRWVAESAVLVVAAAATTLLLVRGSGAPARSIAGAAPTTDPLLVVTPVLAALAVCVVVIRLYPIPLAAIERALARRRGVVGFLGAARSRRDTLAGVAPVLALVLGMAVAVSATTLTTTIGHGIREAAEIEVGADVRLTGPTWTEPVLERIAALPETATVTPVVSAGLSSLRIGDTRRSVAVYLVDAAALAKQQRGLSGALPSALADAVADADASADGGTPAVVSPSLAGVALEAERGALDPVAVQPAVAGVVPAGDFVVLDVSGRDAVGIGGVSPRTALVVLTAGADPAAFTDAVAAFVPGFSAETVAEASADVTASPMVAALPTTLWLSLGYAGALVGVAVVLLLVLGTPTRRRMLGLVGILGLDRRQARGLTAWEVGPVAITALVAGSATGTGLALLARASIDLRPFTGGALPPTLAVDPLLVGGVLVGFIGLVVAGAAAAAGIARLADAAADLREGDAS